MKNYQDADNKNSKESLIIEEPWASYFSPHNPANNLETSMKYQKPGDIFANKMLLVRTIQKGVNISLFESIKTITPFTDNDWCDFLNISLKSMQRYKNDSEHVFKPIHSEKIIELAEVAALGHEVFDTEDQFYTWLKTSSIALGSMQPIELLRDSYGKEMVLSELHRIDHGIFA